MVLPHRTPIPSVVVDKTAETPSGQNGSRQRRGLQGMQLRRKMAGIYTSQNNLSENLWIEETFQKRECIKFISTEFEHFRCVCGRLRTNHATVADGVVRTAYPAEKWMINRHTELKPTDAYGTIEFQGGPHPTKAQYIRLSYDTKPDKILQLLEEFWGLQFPKLLISVHGGVANFNLQPKLRRVWRQGLLRAAKTTGAWIVTGGMNTGVMKYVGDALGDTLIQCRSNIVTLGIVPWGIVHKRDELLGKDTVVPFHAMMAAPNNNNVLLNSNHSYFLLADDGTDGQVGCETVLRKKLEKCISSRTPAHANFTRNSVRDHRTPIVYVIMEGGRSAIQTVLDCVNDEPPFPVVVIDGSGRAADLIAFTHKYSNDDGTMPETLRDQLIAIVKKAFCCSAVDAEKTFIELMMCMKDKKHLITIYRIQENTQDIDQAILAALLKSQNVNAHDQLSLALAWDRADIARRHIFVFGQEWPAGALDQAMMDALANDRIDFVKLLIENGVNMHKWLTIERLEDLYNLGLVSAKSTPVKVLFASTRHRHDTSSTLRHLLTEIKRHVPTDYKYTLLDIGQVINKLMGGAYRSTYCRKKFRMTYNAVMNKGCGIAKVIGFVPTLDAIPLVNNNFQYPYSELMVWAVLLRKQAMAHFMWERGEEALAKSLIACKLYKSLACESEEDELEIDVANELDKCSETFGDLAVELLEHCFKMDDDYTRLLLTYELSNWSDQTSMSLAMSAKQMSFIASTGCQIVVTDMWMGGLRTRKCANLKVILGILFFPFIRLLNFRSVEELQMMPQTVEEHQQDSRGGGSVTDGESDMDSDGDSDLDGLSVASRRSNQSGMAAKEKNNQERISTDNLKSNSPPASHQKSLSQPLIAFECEKKRSPLRIGKKFYEFYTAPITKFWMHTISFVIFMLVFIYLVLIETPPEPTWLEWCVIAYMVGLAMEKVREFLISEPTSARQKLSVFFTDIWNVFDTITFVLFFTGVAVRLVPGLSGHGRVFYCLAVAMCVSRILDLFAVSQYLGPFVHIIGKMIVELLYFVVFVLVILVAFGTFRQALWYPYEDFRWELVRDIFLKPYFMLYGEVYADEIWPDCSEDTEAEYTCVPGRWLVPIGQSIFLIIGIILLLSILIAVFNSVFNKSYIHSNKVWKFQRYNLVIEYESKPVVPSPFIIVIHFYLLVKYIRRKWMNKMKLLDNGLKCFLNEDEVEKLHDFEEECMEIYYREKENLSSVTMETRMKMTMDKLENINLRVDDIHQKESSFYLSLQTMESHLAAIENVSLQTAQALHHLCQSIVSLPHPCHLQQPSPSRCVVATRSSPRYATRNSNNSSRYTYERHLSLGEKSEMRPRCSTDYARSKDERESLFCNGRFYNAPKLVFPEKPSFENKGFSPHGSERLLRRQSCSACPDPAVVFPEGERSGGGGGGRVRKEDLHVHFLVDEDELAKTSGRNDRTFSDYVDAWKPFGRSSCDDRSVVRRSLPSDVLLGVGSRRDRPHRASPLLPIVTPARTEYTSITDDIDTSCVASHSPPNTPMTFQSSVGVERTHHPKHRRSAGTSAAGRKKRRTAPNDRLKKAEETVHEEMAFIVHKRIRQISLTETERTTTGNLAKRALRSLIDEGGSDDDDDGHRSENETVTKSSMKKKPMRRSGSEGLKPIRSEPVLKKSSENDEKEEEEEEEEGAYFDESDSCRDGNVDEKPFSFEVKVDLHSIASDL